MNDAHSLSDKLNSLELTRIICQVLREEIGFHDTYAEMLAHPITEGLRRHLGGQKYYIAAPAPASLLRDQAIRAEFNGRNIADIMAKYKISRATVYRALGSGK